MTVSKTLVRCTNLPTKAGTSTAAFGYNDMGRLAGSKFQSTHNYPSTAQKSRRLGPS